MPLVLGIESSCDETAAAVVRDGRTVLSSVVHTQIAAHRPYGGVVPEIASRAHVENFPAVVAAAIEQAAGAEGVGVVFKCRHLCMMMRGVEKQNSEMVTSAMLGSFRSDEKVRSEFLSLIDG